MFEAETYLEEYTQVYSMLFLVSECITVNFINLPKTQTKILIYFSLFVSQISGILTDLENIAGKMWLYRYTLYFVQTKIQNH